MAEMTPERARRAFRRWLIAGGALSLAWLAVIAIGLSEIKFVFQVAATVSLFSALYWLGWARGRESSTTSDTPVDAAFEAESSSGSESSID